MGSFFTAMGDDPHKARFGRSGLRTATISYTVLYFHLYAEAISICIHFLCQCPSCTHISPSKSRNPGSLLRDLSIPSESSMRCDTRLEHTNMNIMLEMSEEIQERRDFRLMHAALNVTCELYRFPVQRYKPLGHLLFQI